MTTPKTEKTQDTAPKEPTEYVILQGPPAGQAGDAYTMLGTVKALNAKAAIEQQAGTLSDLDLASGVTYVAVARSHFAARVVKVETTRRIVAS